MNDIEGEANNTITSMLKQVLTDQKDDYYDYESSQAFQAEELKFTDEETLQDSSSDIIDIFTKRSFHSNKFKTTKEYNSILSKNSNDFTLTDTNNIRTKHKKAFKTTHLNLPQSSTTITNNNNFNIYFNNSNNSNSNNNQIYLQNILTQFESSLSQSQCISENIFRYFQSNFINIIKTQIGSRLIQNYLPKTSPIIINKIFITIIPSLPILLCDPFATHSCLQLFFSLSSNERILFLYAISPQLSSLSINNISTYPIQCIISNLTTQQEKDIILNNINNIYSLLAYDIYGCHVLEKVLLCLDDNFKSPIMNFIISNFISLATHVNGLCLAKKAILIANNPNSTYYHVLKRIISEHCLTLVQNPYGNYAIQVVIDNWNKNDVLDIISALYGYMSLLATMKYSSNVIEKLIKFSEEVLSMFIKETCVDNGTIGKVVKDSFGNYVVQTALKVSKGNMKMILITSIDNNLHELDDVRLIKKWKLILAENIAYANRN